MPTTGLRCAELARAGEYLPAGSAASAPVYLLVELPLPWPADVADHPLLEATVPAAARHRARIQALVPDPGMGATAPGTARAIVYRAPEGPFDRFTRHEAVVAVDRLADEIDALLGASAAPPTDGRDGDPAGVVADVLVCTHGSRDVCCGGDGMRVHRELTALASRTLPGVRVWRTSHTGGHRFAPTAVTFPDGRAWASLSADLLAGIVTRTVSVGEAARHDRGGAAFADPFAQAADGAVLAAEGWSWLDTPRTVDVQPLPGDDTRRLVTVTARDVGTGNGDGVKRVAYRAEVAVRRIVPVPDCGRPLDQARKSAPELEVLNLTRL